MTVLDPRMDEVVVQTDYQSLQFGSSLFPLVFRLNKNCAERAVVWSNKWTTEYDNLVVYFMVWSYWETGLL